MNTPSHFLISAAIYKAAKINWLRKSAVWSGSIAPDIPLYVLTFSGLFYYTQFQGWTASQAAQHIFDRLYFHNTFWIASHNLLHSPTSLFILIGVSLLSLKVYPVLSHWMISFFASCGLHSVIDILTHYDDGPLLLWPFEWTLRFQSPVSYWDHRHYGSEFMWFEFALVIVLTIYVAIPWLYRLIKRFLNSQNTAVG